MKWSVFIFIFHHLQLEQGATGQKIQGFVVGKSKIFRSRNIVGSLSSASSSSSALIFVICLSLFWWGVIHILHLAVFPCNLLDFLGGSCEKISTSHIHCPCSHSQRFPQRKQEELLLGSSVPPLHAVKAAENRFLGQNCVKIWFQDGWWGWRCRSLARRHWRPIFSSKKPTWARLSSPRTPLSPPSSPTSGRLDDQVTLSCLTSSPPRPTWSWSPSSSSALSSTPQWEDDWCPDSNVSDLENDQQCINSSTTNWDCPAIYNKVCLQFSFFIVFFF